MGQEVVCTATECVRVCAPGGPGMEEESEAWAFSWGRWRSVLPQPWACEGPEEKPDVPAPAAPGEGHSRGQAAAPRGRKSTCVWHPSKTPGLQAGGEGEDRGGGGSADSLSM